MESVIVGVDSSESSKRALWFALRRAHINEWRVLVVHVINWSPYSFPTLEENEKRPVTRKKQLKAARKEIIDPLLEQAAGEGLLDGIEVASAVHFGRPSEMLSDLADEGSYDAIVVARTGDSGLKAAIFGTTASRLVQHAPVPVVVVP
ncbi:MAG: universal stress protein [Leucobacter sp.]